MASDASLICPSCGTANPPQAHFCMSCASPLPATSDVPPRARLGTRERKVATMLFADIVGFTSLGESRDPELVQALVSRAFDRLSEEVERYQGLVEKFAGDAMLAVFGVPSVHEDDAERAVRAALEMQSAMARLSGELRVEGRPELNLRIGVETGEVLVDQGRAEGERDRMVTGDAVNTAARLQQTAPAGAVLVGAATYAATRELVDYEELEPIALKGKSLPVAAWRAVSVKARRGGVRAPIGIEAPIIGRDEELALLKDTVRRTAAEGRPHLVTVIGSAGVGKSRLTWELEKYLDGLPEIYYWRKGRCLAYAQSSYGALADIVKADARVLDDDPPAEAEGKLEARLRELAPGDGAGAIGQGLRAVLALEAPALSRDDLFDAWRRYLELIASSNPLLLVLEDIHWADEGLLEFVEFLSRWGEGPIMTLGLARHELLERRPSWGGGIHNAASIVLEPLDRGETGRLLDALLEGSAPAELKERLIRIGDGNPLFTEELVRMLVDRGDVRFTDGAWQAAGSLREVEVPGSIHAVLAARLDGLPAAEKRAAQNAAVIGRIFWDGALAALTGEAAASVRDRVRGLRVKELVVPREPSSLSEEGEYSFRHVLVRDVAYESLPKSERAAKHLAVARWAEERFGDRQDELVELLATHYLSALRYEEDFAAADSQHLTDLRRRTLEHVRRASRRAEDLWQLEAATRWARVALDESGRLGIGGRERTELLLTYLQVGSTLEPLQSQLDASTEALSLVGDLDPATNPGDGRLVGRVRATHAYAQFVIGDVDGSRRTLEEGIAMLESGPPTPERAELIARLGWTYWRAGPLPAAIAPLRRAIEEARVSGGDRTERWAVHDLGIATGYLAGQRLEGIRLIEQSLEMARAADDRILMLRCHNNLSETIRDQGGDLRRAIELAQEGVNLAQRSGAPLMESWLHASIAASMADLGRLREAVESQRRSIALVDASGERPSMGYRRRELASLLKLAGHHREADQVWEEALQFDAPPEPQNMLWYAMQDAVRRWRDEPQAAVGELAAVLAGAHEMIPQRFQLACRYLARMAFRTGQVAEVELAARLAARESRDSLGPRHPLTAEWIGQLVSPDPAAAVHTIERVASELAQLGVLLGVADAYADVALVSARAGLPALEWVERAESLYAQCGAEPLLGPLPERRWLAAGDQ